MNHTVARFLSASDFLGNMSPPDAGSFPGKGFQCQTESEVSHSSCSSGCSGHESPTSLMSYQCMFQRSTSSHSLQRSGPHHPVSASFADLLEEAPVRKVYSAGDLQRMNVVQNNVRSLSGSLLRSESSMIIEGMRRAYPYSPEEKRVRIERYRIKRHKRNFNKKIKYECRKTLADNRPRIRGRFAKSEETEKKSHMSENESGEEEEDENWASFFENLVVANHVHEP